MLEVWEKNTVHCPLGEITYCVLDFPHKLYLQLAARFPAPLEIFITMSRKKEGRSSFIQR